MNPDLISTLLSSSKQDIENDDYSSAINRLQSFASDHPDAVDARLLAEFSLLEKLMDYKSVLKDWSYFYSIRLVYDYCMKRYASELTPTAPLSDLTLPDSNVIWCCWLQGIDQAPEIVKICVNSLKLLGREIRFVTEKNYTDHISLPEEILKKRKDGTISNAHFSDLLRITLLTERGGTWIDATVFCTDAAFITEVLSSYPLFCYSFAMRDSISEHIMFDNWLLHATKPSRILEDTKTMLYSYWKNESETMHYFIFHIMFSIACRRHSEESLRIPVFSLEPAHILQHEMMRPYDPLRWKHIMQMSGIHKLTYKYPQNADIKGTMLEHILSTNILQ